MWEKLCSLILRNRRGILITLGLITLFMGYQGSKVEMSYEFSKLLPSDDSAIIEYQRFKEIFGDDGNVLAIGTDEKDLFTLEKFNAWYNLGNELKKIEGVHDVISIAHLYNLTKNDSVKKFDFVPVVQTTPKTQAELDSLKNVIFSLPFYKSKIYNDTSRATLMAITLDSKLINTKERGKFIELIRHTIEQNVEGKNISIHYSGLPFIRNNNTTKVKAELQLFIFLAIIVTAFILYLFFRSFKVTGFSMLVVFVGVIWSLGTVELFGYQITILLGLIPSLIIVIGIPNCIFLVNKYHNEYKKHGNQARALSRVIGKIGGAALMTNATTAVGFAAFIFTNSRLLQEFGVIASINIIFVFLLSILLIPIVFSYMAPPKKKHIKHLENKWVQKYILYLEKIVNEKRKWVYIVSIIITIAAVYGMTLIKTTGNLVDDLPKNDPVYTDLLFFERNFTGVMPFEVIIDCKKEGAATQLATLKKIDRLHDVIASYPEFSRPVSIAEGVKFAKQAYYGGSPAKYALPNDLEKSFLAPYFKGKGGESEYVLSNFLDSSKRYTRVSAQMADIGTKEMARIKEDIRPRIDSIFNPEKFNVTLTGNSIVFLKGTTFLVDNLLSSLVLAVIVISVLMSFLFSSLRMVLVSLLPNLVPLLVTAGIMGYFGIAIKPSTILVFSIAFGISVDDTIHYLAKYRQELKIRKWDIKGSALISLKESGVSMMYTSIILFFGFGIFAISKFGGTVALGVLVSVTLLVAMLSNLVLLPSLLLTLEKRLTTKAFKEPFVQIIDEEEDIDLNELILKRNESKK